MPPRPPKKKGGKFNAKRISIPKGLRSSASLKMAANWSASKDNPTNDEGLTANQMYKRQKYRDGPGRR